MPRLDLTFADRHPRPTSPEWQAATHELWALVPESVRRPDIARRLAPDAPQEVWETVWQQPSAWESVAGEPQAKMRGPKIVLPVPDALVARLQEHGGPWALDALGRLPGVRRASMNGEATLGWLWDHALETLSGDSAWNPIVDIIWRYRGAPHPHMQRLDRFPRDKGWGTGPMQGWIQRLPEGHEAVATIAHPVMPRDLTQTTAWAQWLTAELADAPLEVKAHCLRVMENPIMRREVVMRIAQPWPEDVIALLTVEEHVVRLRHLPPEARTRAEGERAWELLGLCVDPTQAPPPGSIAQIESWARNLLDIAVTYRPERPDLVARRQQLLDWAVTPPGARTPDIERLTARLEVQTAGLGPWLCDGFTLPTAAVSLNELERLWAYAARTSPGLQGRIAGHPAIPFPRAKEMLRELATRRREIVEERARLISRAQQAGQYSSGATTLEWKLTQLDDQLRDTTRLLAANPELGEDADFAKSWATLAPLEEALRLITRLGPTHPSTPAVVDGLVTGHPVESVARHLLQAKWAPLAPLIPARAWRPLLLAEDREVRLLAARLLGQAETMQQAGAVAEPLAPLPPRKKVRRLPMIRSNGSHWI